MKSLIISIWALFFNYLAIAEPSPVVLEDGKNFYEVGLHLELLEDPTGNLTINDVIRPEWANKFKRSKEKVPNFGFSKSAHWARININNFAKNQKTWIISQNYALQDRITLYKKIDGHWTPFSTGDATPFKTREIKDKTFSFEIKPSKNSLYFFRIMGAANRFNLTISSPKIFTQNRTKDNLVSGLFFGLVISMVLYNLFIFISTKSLGYLYYVLYVLFYGITLFILQGFSLRFLAPNSVWIANNGVSFFGGLVVLFMSLFSISFLRLNEQNPRLYKGALFFCITSSLLILSSLFLPYSVTIKLIALTILSTLPFLLFCGIYRVKENYRPAKYFLLATFFVILGGIILVLMSMGILPPTDLIKQAPYIGNAMELILLSMGLADRFNYQQEQALMKEKELTENLESSHQKLNIMYTKIERSNEELEGKVAERTKEILESEKNVSNLLNNMRQSVFSIDEKGLIIPPVSDYSYEIFGENIERKSIFETLLKNIDKKSEIYCQLSFVIDVALDADLFQYQVIQDSLPRELPFIYKDEKEKSLKISYAPILNKNDIVQKIMLVVEDITELKKLEKDAIESEAASAIKIKRLQEIVSQDKKSFRTFSRDVNLNFNLARKSIEKRDINGFFRAIHTVKGNARIYNLTGLSGEIHIIESQVIELRDNKVHKELSENQLEKIFTIFKETVENYLGLAREIFGDDIDETFSFLDKDSIEISKSLFLNSLDQLKQMAHENNSSGILEVVKKLSFEKFNNSLLGIQSIVLKISTSLNKNIRLDILGDDIYLDVKKSSMLKDSIMHIIQNSCDHGIENEGVIKIELLEEGKDISIIISDNGKGIDPLVIRKMALEKGIIGVEEVKDFGVEEDLSLIMRPGFSTKKVATEYSGRGVGLDVVQTNIRDLGGSIKLSSVLGEGTTFQIKVPKS